MLNICRASFVLLSILCSVVCLYVAVSEIFYMAGVSAAPAPSPFFLMGCFFYASVSMLNDAIKDIEKYGWLPEDDE